MVNMHAVDKTTAAGMAHTVARIVLVIVQDLGPSLGSSVDHLLIIVQAFLVLSYIWAHNRPINIITGVILPEPSG
jgi:hypothetical protein